MDSMSEARLTQVHPLLAAKVREGADPLAKEGIIIRVVEGLRTFQEQAELYAKGRTAAGPKVTNAPPGSSYHNYGMAVDLIPSITPSGPWTPDWKNRDTNHHLTPHYQRMVEVFESPGLYSGSDFHSICDDPHLQLTGELPVGAPTLEARNLLASHGMEAVWNLAGLVVPESTQV